MFIVRFWCYIFDAGYCVKMINVTSNIRVMDHDKEYDNIFTRDRIALQYLYIPNRDHLPVKMEKNVSFWSLKCCA